MLRQDERAGDPVSNGQSNLQAPWAILWSQTCICDGHATAIVIPSDQGPMERPAPRVYHSSLDGARDGDFRVSGYRRPPSTSSRARTAAQRRSHDTIRLRGRDPERTGGCTTEAARSNADVV